MSNCERMTKMGWLAGLFAFFLLLSLVDPCTGDTGPQTVVVFKGGSTEIPYKTESGAKAVHKPSDFRVPAFVGGVVNNKEFLAVFADARYDQSSGSTFIDPVVRTSSGNYKEWSDAKHFANTTLNNGENAVLGNVTAVMKKDKIFALATRFNKLSSAASASTGSTTGLETVLFVGTVVSSKDSGDKGVTVMWEKEKSLKSLLEGTFDESYLSRVVGGVGNGVVTKKGIIVLPVQVVYRDNFHNQASSIIYSSDDGVTWHMGRSPVFTTSDCSVVEWGDGNLLLSARFDWGFRVVYESNNMGSTWKLSPVFMAAWGNSEKHSSQGSQGSVITAPVDKKDVLLFSHPLNTDKNNIRDILQLWVSDGQRIACVGTISENKKEQHTGNSILAHFGDHLYITHEINPSASLDQTFPTGGELDKVIALSRLSQLFESAQNTVRAWRRLDEWLRTKGVPSNGLVGLLGNTETDNSVWTDKYKCVNATVKGGKRVNGGFRFNGTPGSGAQWPVRNQGQHQIYVFSKVQFTLAATITIHSTGSAGDNSLIGAGQFALNSDILVGLGYTQERKWYTVHGKGSKTLSELSFELEEECHLALTFDNGVIGVYIDGLNIKNERRPAYFTNWINNFYIGGVGTGPEATGSSCTVRNVMLYNRSLGQEEIAQLSKVSKTNNLKEPMPGDEPLSALQNSKMASKTELKGQKMSNNNGDDNSGVQSLRDDRYHLIQKQIKTADAAVVLFAFFPLLCFVCSIVVLAGV